MNNITNYIAKINNEMEVVHESVRRELVIKFIMKNEGVDKIAAMDIFSNEFSTLINK